MTRGRMFGPFERAVAGRYLRARKGERFVSIIAIFSLIGIALGVATLIIVTSVMSGFQTELVSRILGCQRTHHRRGLCRRQDRQLSAAAGRYPCHSRHRVCAAGARRPGAADRPIAAVRAADWCAASARRSAHAASGQRPRHGRQARRFPGRRCDRHRHRTCPVLSTPDRQFTHGDLAAGRRDGIRHRPARPRLQGRGGVRRRPQRLQQQRGVHAASRGADLLPDNPTRSPASRSASPTRTTWARCCRHCKRPLAPARSGCATGGTPTTPSSACFRCRRTRCSLSLA